MKNLSYKTIFIFFLIVLPGGIVYAQNTASSTIPTTVNITGSATTSSSSTLLSLVIPPPPPDPTAFTLTSGQQNFSIDQNTVDSWHESQTVYPSTLLEPPTQAFGNLLLASFGQTPLPAAEGQTFNYNLADVYNYIERLSSQLDATTVEPSLIIQNGRATSFTPPQTGTQVDIYQSALATLKALRSGQPKLELTVYQMPPQTQLSSLNNLGINELVAEGVSKFNGSPNNRRHNIAAGITKFAGLIIPPNAEFSFDNSLGPVTADAGFLPELVIDNGTTLPELGGGLCQVSTTVFRAAMAAGFPITDRRNHAYAVQYYSPQGTDATIYPGSADLKFINDSPADILVWPYEKDKNTLVFDFYGTKDDRQVTLEKPVVFDRKPDGSMKATWTRIVTKVGQTSTSTFYSVYQSPALFHETESYVSATGAKLPAQTSLKMPTKTE